mgnify:CR=1 FL=1
MISRESPFYSGHHSSLGVDFASDLGFPVSSLTSGMECRCNVTASPSALSAVMGSGGPTTHCGVSADAASTNTIGISGTTRTLETASPERMCGSSIDDSRGKKACQECRREIARTNAAIISQNAAVASQRKIE